MRDGRVDAAESQLDGRMARRRIHHRVGDQNRIDRRRTFREKRAGNRNRDVGRAESRSQQNADTVAVFLRHGDMRIFKRQAGRRRRQKRRPVHPPQIPDGDEVARVEIAHFRTQPRRGRLRVERLHRPDAACTGKQPLGKGALPHAQRRGHSQAGHHDAPGVR